MPSRFRAPKHPRWLSITSRVVRVVISVLSAW
jgi:hypothetical protein